MEQQALPFASVNIPRSADDVHPAPCTPHVAPGTSTLHLAPGTQHPSRVAFVRHPRARRYVLRVLDDGTIRITVPRWGSKREARAFAESQQRWIDRQLRRLEQEQAHPRPVLPAEDVREWRM